MEDYFTIADYNTLYIPQYHRNNHLSSSLRFQWLTTNLHESNFKWSTPHTCRK